MVRVLTQLVTTMYKPGEVIIDLRSKVKDLIIIMKGECNLYGFSPAQNSEEPDKMHVVTLPEQSWYGDFQILLNLESSFSLEAGVRKRKANH